MDAKALPLRLDPETHRRLKELAELEGSTMVQLVRRALDAFLPGLAAAHEDEMEATLARLRSLSRTAEARRAEAEGLARAEVEHTDALESELQVEERGHSLLADQVLEAFGDLG